MLRRRTTSPRPPPKCVSSFRRLLTHRKSALELHVDGAVDRNVNCARVTIYPAVAGESVILLVPQLFEFHLRLLRNTRRRRNLTFGAVEGIRHGRGGVRDKVAID